MLRRTLFTPLVVLLGACTTDVGDPAEVELEPSRVKTVGEPLNLVDEGEISTKGIVQSGGMRFTYVASVASPVLADGRTLQATGFALKSRYAYVVYNMANESIAGALDILDLSDPRSPRLLSTLRFPNAEFSDIKVTGNRAYLVGARSDAPTGAVLKVIDVTRPSAPSEQASIALPGFYATSIAIDGNGKGFITTGDNGGLQAFRYNPGRSEASLEAYYPLSNALFVRVFRGRPLVLGGAQTSLFEVRGNQLENVHTLTATSIAAPGRMRSVKGTAFTNAGTSGLSAFDLQTRTLVYSANLIGTGNGIDSRGGLGFLAQGEAGTSVYDVRRASAPVRLGQFSFPDERGSANNLKGGHIAGTNYVFLGSGLTGFRIISFTEVNGLTAQCQANGSRDNDDYADCEDDDDLSDLVENEGCAGRRN